MSTPTIAVTGLEFKYPDGTSALGGIDLHIHPGERVALLGPNGAGKTTLVLHLNGIHMPQQGTVAVSGLQLAKDNVMEIRRRVGIVFHLTSVPRPTLIVGQSGQTDEVFQCG